MFPLRGQYSSVHHKKRKVDGLQRFVEITLVKVVLVSMESRINIYSFIQISEIVIINTHKRIYDI